MFIFILGLVSAIILITIPVIRPDTIVYTYLFEHKYYKLWRYYINHAHCFQFAFEENGNRVYNWHDIQAIVWNNGLCTIRVPGKCVLDDYPEEFSRKMANLLVDDQTSHDLP